MVLAKPRGRVAVPLEDLTDGSLVRGDDGIIARKARGHFADHPETRRVVVAPGDERRARGRAQRRRMKLRVA